MADTTWGVKVSEEFKAELNGLIGRSGLQSKDFIEHMVELYKVEKSKEQMPGSASDIEELQTLTKRIFNIYVNMGYRVDNILKEKEEVYTKRLEEGEKKVVQLQGAVEGAKLDVDSYKEMYSRLFHEKSEAEQQALRLQETVDSQKQLVSSLNEKIDTLTGIVNEYKGYKEENVNLIKDLERLENDFRQAKVLLQDKEAEIRQIGREFDRLKADHEVELKRAHDTLIVEKEKAIISVTRDYEDKIHLMREEFNEKIHSLLVELEKARKPEPKPQGKKKEGASGEEQTKA